MDQTQRVRCPQCDATAGLMVQGVIADRQAVAVQCIKPSCGREFEIAFAPHPLLIDAKRGREALTLVRDAAALYSELDFFFTWLADGGDTYPEQVKDYQQKVSAHADRIRAILAETHQEPAP